MNLTKTKEILEQLVRIHSEKNLLDEELKDIKEADVYGGLKGERWLS